MNGCTIHQHFYIPLEIGISSMMSSVKYKANNHLIPKGILTGRWKRTNPQNSNNHQRPEVQHPGPLFILYKKCYDVS